MALERSNLVCNLISDSSNRPYSRALSPRRPRRNLKVSCEVWRNSWQPIWARQTFRWYTQKPSLTRLPRIKSNKLRYCLQRTLSYTFYFGPFYYFNVGSLSTFEGSKMSYTPCNKENVPFHINPTKSSKLLLELEHWNKNGRRLFWKEHHPSQRSQSR